MTNLLALAERIKGYLTGGGLFNPELADHMAVRDLLLECRDALREAHERLEGAYGSIREHMESLREAHAEIERHQMARVDIEHANAFLQAENERLRQQLGQPLETERENERLRKLEMYVKDARRLMREGKPVPWSVINDALAGEKHD